MYVASSGARRSAAVGLAVAAAAIPVQIAGGMDYPAVPPGLIILTVAAAIALFARPRWALAVPAVAAAFLTVGATAAPNARDALSAPGETVAFAATLLQAAGLVVGLVCCVVALARRASAA
ncbi:MULTISPECIES: hypothetical protein [unclassified Actinomadura]|uniref:hypothetical protein n=1 Tax=unclassified Actinomadura TaxID=2626254 RepID=UPI0011EC61B2|nr:hypothetical protein [Actinomadura sp. K4S16]